MWFNFLGITFLLGTLPHTSPHAAMGAGISEDRSSAGLDRSIRALAKGRLEEKAQRNNHEIDRYRYRSLTHFSMRINEINHAQKQSEKRRILLLRQPSASDLTR